MGSVCNTLGLVAGNAGYFYTIFCTAPNQFTIYRNWSWVSCVPGFQYGVFGCGGASNVGQSSKAVTISCSSPSGSGISLVTIGTPLADPITGTLSFS